jgi:transposase
MAFRSYCPNYHSISDFRKDNPIALKKVIQTLCSLKDADLLYGETIAIDGTKNAPTIARK